jgi:hypothetical protein
MEKKALDTVIVSLEIQGDDSFRERTKLQQSIKDIGKE